MENLFLRSQEEGPIDLFQLLSQFNVIKIASDIDRLEVYNILKHSIRLIIETYKMEISKTDPSLIS